MDDSGISAHPPRHYLEIAKSRNELAAKVAGLQAFQNRMSDLLRLTNDLVANLDLPQLLQRLVELGVELLDAQYGAMGVIHDDGEGLAQFIHVGMDEETVRGIGDYPHGRGLLGALIIQPKPVRLKRLADDPRSSGFPANHPPMDSFLGVPIRVRNEVFGNLYLTNSVHGEFSAYDEEVAQALAATAGIAIENARLFEDSAYRAKWSTALAEESRQLMKNDDEGDDLSGLISRLADLADSDVLAILTASDNEIVLNHINSRESMNSDLIGYRFPVTSGFVDAVRGTTTPIRVADLMELYPELKPYNIGPAILMPVIASDEQTSVLLLGKTPAGRPFADRDIEMVVAFSRHISLVLERHQSRENRRRLDLMMDRTRIARDLHDHVIQRLFAIGLNLHGLSAHLLPEQAEGVAAQIDELDGAIKQIRQSIFSLTRMPHSAETLRSRVIEAVERLNGHVANNIEVEFQGPVDTLANEGLTDDVVATVTEALSNAVRHADARKIHVTVSVNGDQLAVECLDDGVGPAVGRTTGNGLPNLRARARSRGGRFQVTAAHPGTRVVWSAPI